MVIHELAYNIGVRHVWFGDGEINKITNQSSKSSQTNNHHLPYYVSH